MIDTHCHLEQEDYDKDRDSVIERCKEALDAVVTSSAHPKDWELTMQLVEKYPNFVYATASIHPLYVKEISESQKKEYFELIRKNKSKIVGIGECGTDYWWVKEKEWREKQRQLFIELIGLAKGLNMSLVIHSRNGKDKSNAVEDAINILEQQNAERVQMHMFTSRGLLQRVLDNGWMVSINTLLFRSKSVRKIVRDCPLERLMLETDAPWLAVGEDGTIKEPKEKRNEPTAVNLVAEKIAEIKKLTVDEVDRMTTENAKKFFNLRINQL
jgi:TatD DNase family protein